MTRLSAGVFLTLFAAFAAIAAGGRDISGDSLRLPSETLRFFRASQNRKDCDDISRGTRWAVLIAGSSRYRNYRHQANICHAYQLLRKEGVKEENIVVFMYDDIAHDSENPRPGIIINSPHGEDVYKGVPKDYIGDDVNVDNFFAVILGDKTALKGGSGKFVDSGANDHILIYYSDHGGLGVLGMRTNPYHLNDVLKKKHAFRIYKSLVFYLEACKSRSIFEGLLPEGLNIYATTTSNVEESSWVTYCPVETTSPPPKFETFLGDLYNVAGMEDSDIHNLQTEASHQQFELVKKSSWTDNAVGSHVMQYDDVELSKDSLYTYMDTNPTNDDNTYIDANSLRPRPTVISQRDADLEYFWLEFLEAPEGSIAKFEAQKQLAEELSHRMHIDHSFGLIGKLIFGIEKGSEILSAVRPAGHRLVDDWDCLKSLVKTYEMHCGSLSHYGLKYMRALANICNAGITKEKMAEVSAEACMSFPSNPLSSLHKGFSA